MAVLAPAYRPRRPQDTLLHRVVREHLETFLSHAARARTSNGSDKTHCRTGTEVDAKILTAIVRAFATALGERHRAWARGIGIERSEFGAVTFVQRFGSSLNLNVHLHVTAVDGVFSRDDRGGLCFTAAPPPTYAEMLDVVQSVKRRVDKLLMPQTSSDNDVPQEHPLDVCVRIALSRGEVRAVTAELEDADEVAQPSAPHDGAAVDEDGFNLEAGVRIDAADDFGREHLLRYCARPPLSLGRLVELPHGKLGYRIKKLRNGRSKLRVLTPLELLARLAALVPPPRHPLVRFHGAYAPRSSWRRDVLPKPPAPVPKKSTTTRPSPRRHRSRPRRRSQRHVVHDHHRAQDSSHAPSRSRPTCSASITGTG